MVMTPRDHDPKTTGFAHPAFLYRSSAEFLDHTSRFVLEALAADQPVLVALPPANLELLQRRMGPAGAQVLWLDMTDAGRNPGRILPTVLTAFADQHSGRRVAMIGEPIWAGRSAGEYAAAVQHEALINLAFADRPATILCPYDTARLSPTALADAARTHPDLIEGSVHRVSDDYTDPATVAADAVGLLPDPPPDAAALVLFDDGDLAKTRPFVEEHAARCGLSGTRLDELELAVHEAATNTVTHAPSPGVVRIWRDDHTVVCEIRDRGHIADPLAGRHPGGVDQEHGYGLLMIHQLCDLVHLHSHPAGTTLRMHIALPGELAG